MGALLSQSEDDGAGGAGAPPAPPSDAAGAGGSMPSDWHIRNAEGEGDTSSPSDAVLYIKTLTGLTLTITPIPWQATVLWLKRRIEEQTGVPPGAQSLIFAGSKKENSRKLQWLGAQTESTLHLIVKDEWKAKLDKADSHVGTKAD